MHRTVTTLMARTHVAAMLATHWTPMVLVVVTLMSVHWTLMAVLKTVRILLVPTLVVATLDTGLTLINTDVMVSGLDLDAITTISLSTLTTDTVMT